MADLDIIELSYMASVGGKKQEDEPLMNIKIA